MNRKEFFESPKGKLHLFRQRKLERFGACVRGVEPQSKSMKEADKNLAQRVVVKALEEAKQPAYRGPIGLEIDLATTGKSPPHIQTIAKNLLDLLKGEERKALLYRDDSQIHALSVSCRHGQTHPYISIHSRRFSSVLKDLEVAVEALHSADDAWNQLRDEELDEDSIDSFKDLIKNEQRSRAALGDALYDSFFKGMRWYAQRQLLKLSRITTAELAWLYGLPKNPTSKQLYSQWNHFFQSHPLRVTLSELPQTHGASDAFKRAIDSEIAKFKRRYDWIIRPLVVSVALEVIVRPSPSVPKGVLHDLDNVVRSYLLPKFVPAFGTVSDYTWTIDFDELARRDPELRRRWGDSPTPPKGTRDGVTRFEVWRLPSASDGSEGFVSVALVADDGFGGSLVRQIDDQVRRSETEFAESTLS
jgi:Holliday junction resolvase RusA-like endonuclease